MSRNDIHYEAYEFRAGRVILILRQAEEVWLSDLPPEIARRVQEMQALSGEEGNLARLINVDADLLGRIEVVEDVPRGTVLHSGELAPFRRWVFNTAQTLSDASGMSFRMTALGWMGVSVVSLIFPPVAPIAVAFGKAALISAGGILASGAVEGGAAQVRKGYVRFTGRVITNLPPHKAIASEAQFVGTMKNSHFDVLRKQMHKYSDGTEPLPQDLQIEKGNYA